MPSLFPVDDMIGAAQIGVLVSTLIFGITCLQVYRYYTEHCERDRTLLKAWVAAVMVLDTVHMALLAIFMYHYTVTNYGDYAVLLRPTWSLLAEIPIANFLAVMVQLFYAYRIYRRMPPSVAGTMYLNLTAATDFLSVNHNYLTMPLVIAVLCFAHLAVSIVYTVKAFEQPSFAAQVSIESYNTAGLALDIACDSFIAICTTYYLRRGFTGIRSTTRAINKLIAYSLNTCLLTTLIILASLIAWRARGETLIGSAFYFVAMRLYSCSLMSILNSRDGLREELGQKGSNVISLSRLAPTIEFSSGETAAATAAEAGAKGTGDETQKTILASQRSLGSAASD